MNVDKLTFFCTVSFNFDVKNVFFAFSSICNYLFIHLYFSKEIKVAIDALIIFQTFTIFYTFIMSVLIVNEGKNTNGKFHWDSVMNWYSICYENVTLLLLYDEKAKWPKFLIVRVFFRIYGIHKRLLSISILLSPSYSTKY